MKDLYVTTPIVWLMVPSFQRYTENLPMHGNDSDFRVFHGVVNQLDFVVRDNDRKPVSLTGKTLTARITNHYTGEQVIQKDLISITDHLGLARLVLSDTELGPLTPGNYVYSITLTDEELTTKPLYQDRNQTGLGFIILESGVVPQPRQPLTITQFQSRTVQGGAPELLGAQINGSYQFSNSFATNRTLGYNNGVHTFIVQALDFTGKFWIQGNNGTVASDRDDEWFVIDNQIQLSLDAATGNFSFSVVNNSVWTRVVYQPNSVNTGTIQQITVSN